MVNPGILHLVKLLYTTSTTTRGRVRPYISVIYVLRSHYTTRNDPKKDPNNNNSSKWFTLPPFTPSVNGAELGKAISCSRAKTKADATTTALKWVLRCCPELPRSLVQKLFRLRQVRREFSDIEITNVGAEVRQERKLKRVAAKDSMNNGDRIFLPVTVHEFPVEKHNCHCNEEEVNFIRSLVLYKDPAIIVVNKPPGMPVQGGIRIKQSLDELAASCLSYDYSEPPRLVHRLDRDSSGILVMGRTQTSATVLHSIFREKTSGAKDDIDNAGRVLQRKYWALVIGSPRRPKGLISAPLGKVVVDNGKSDRITIVDKAQNMSAQHALTEYQVIRSSCHGYTWLELSPLTGRKHQLRVHCAEVLGTPIVGDLKYGWQTHRKWKHLPWPNVENKSNENLGKGKISPFGLDLESGSISEKHLRLHLHCKQMILPNVSRALENVELSSDYDLSEVESLELVAPLPSFMQRSWDILNS
ncbi:RNA pseudouridine synthase 4, mitochondrial [Morella rubra]|uniref:RNA pseudouridine synthase 4, mitochondrial n=1 Tax=Morella rubra TaxID=262757 RepID=A0A6A1VB84_9ROSI|nr:RNA pseudouridine synthase 4, mitochondrial [Morella rubra]